MLILASSIAMLGFLILTRRPATGGYDPVLAVVMPVGFGTAGIAFATMVTATGCVADPDQGVIGGLINTSRQVGAAIGAALLPAVADAVNHGGLTGAAGVRAAMFIAAAAAAAATAVAWHQPSHTRATPAHPAGCHARPRPLGSLSSTTLAARTRRSAASRRPKPTAEPYRHHRHKEPHQTAETARGRSSQRAEGRIVAGRFADCGRTRSALAVGALFMRHPQGLRRTTGTRSDSGERLMRAGF